MRKTKKSLAVPSLLAFTLSVLVASSVAADCPKSMLMDTSGYCCNKIGERLFCSVDYDSLRIQIQVSIHKGELERTRTTLSQAQEQDGNGDGSSKMAEEKEKIMKIADDAIKLLNELSSFSVPIVYLRGEEKKIIADLDSFYERLDHDDQMLVFKCLFEIKIYGEDVIEMPEIPMSIEGIKPILESMISLRNKIGPDSRYLFSRFLSDWRQEKLDAKTKSMAEEEKTSSSASVPTPSYQPPAYQPPVPLYVPPAIPTVNPLDEYMAQEAERRAKQEQREAEERARKAAYEAEKKARHDECVKGCQKQFDDCMDSYRRTKGEGFSLPSCSASLCLYGCPR